MPFHIAARIHAFIHGLFRPTDEAETRNLYKEVIRHFKQHKLLLEEDRLCFIDNLALAISQEFDVEDNVRSREYFQQLVRRLLDYEGLFMLPDINWRSKRSVSEWWALREQLNAQKLYFEDFEKTVDLLYASLVSFVSPVLNQIPPEDETNDDTTLKVEIPILYGLEKVNEVVESLLFAPSSDELTEQNLFSRLQACLDANLIAASGGNPANPKGFTKTPLIPTKSTIKAPEELAKTYLGGTPFYNFLDQKIDFIIPQKSRFEHSHVIAGSGHGKTQTLQYLICHDLPAIAKGERSVVVIDSQGDLIRNIAHLAEFAPSGPLHDRLVLIDPTDVEWPVSLNLFDVGVERLRDYDSLERERLTNSILELYDFVLGSLLSAEMTQKQNVIFRYVTRLMLHIPDATIHTLRELMEPDSHLKFAESIEKLSGTAKQFFETEFTDREFTQTRKQVLRRLWGILENQTFERMFSHPKSKLDLFEEINAGKVILINTAKDLLKEQGTQIFGRFFIALITQAAQERATLKESDRMPTFVYVDEAADYFDRNIGIILSQARKYKVGMILAHQYLGQLDGKLQESFAANTSIKMAGGVSSKDARTLAATLHCAPEVIENQPKGTFATSIRGHKKYAVPLSFPFGHLENKDRLSKDDWSTLRDKMRDKYAIHYSELEKDLNKDEEQAIGTEPIDNNPVQDPKPKKDPSADAQVSTDPGEQW